MSMDIPTFFAHALALEIEAAERYDELADAMEVHNNADASVLFRNMARFSRKHADEVRGRAANVKVPHFAPWEFKWNGPEGPESAPVERTHYMMKPYHCLVLALHNERRGQEYYAQVAAEATDPEVRRLAKEMADEESEHVVMLEDWLKKTPKPAADWAEDLDPPAQVE